MSRCAKKLGTYAHCAINCGLSNPSLLLQTVRHLDYPSNTPSNLAVTLVVSSLTSIPHGWCSASLPLWDLATFCYSSNPLAFALTLRTVISLHVLPLHNALSVFLRFVCITFKRLYINLRFLFDGKRSLLHFSKPHAELIHLSLAGFG